MRTFFIVTIFVAAIYICQISAESLNQFYATEHLSGTIHEELYLPSGTGLTFFSAGYKNALADLLWFRTINYFGREFSTTQHYEFLERYVNIVVDMNPRLEPVYQFGALMFAWEVHDIDGSIKLLSKGIAAIPDSWLLLYYRGFFYLHFKKDTAKALPDFIQAASLPGAHWIVGDLAQKIKNMPSTQTQQTQEELEDTAAQGMANVTNDASMKQFLRQRSKP